MSRNTSKFFTSVDFGPMVLLDPGSIAYENPKAFGYRMLYDNFRRDAAKTRRPKLGRLDKLRDSILDKGSVGRIDIQVTLRSGYNCMRSTGFSIRQRRTNRENRGLGWKERSRERFRMC